MSANTNSYIELYKQWRAANPKSEEYDVVVQKMDQAWLALTWDEKQEAAEIEFKLWSAEADAIKAIQTSWQTAKKKMFVVVAFFTLILILRFVFDYIAMKL